MVRMSLDIPETTLTIFVLNQTIKKDACHGYCATREEWVIVHSIADFDTSRGVDIASEEGEDVILTRTLERGVKAAQNSAYTTAMAGLDNQTQIWW